MSESADNTRPDLPPPPPVWIEDATSGPNFPVGNPDLQLPPPPGFGFAIQDTRETGIIDNEVPLEFNSHEQSAPLGVVILDKIKRNPRRSLGVAAGIGVVFAGSLMVLSGDDQEGARGIDNRVISGISTEPATTEATLPVETEPVQVVITALPTSTTIRPSTTTTSTMPASTTTAAENPQITILQPTGNSVAANETTLPQTQAPAITQPAAPTTERPTPTTLLEIATTTPEPPIVITTPPAPTMPEIQVPEFTMPTFPTFPNGNPNWGNGNNGGNGDQDHGNDDDDSTTTEVSTTEPQSVYDGICDADIVIVRSGMTFSGIADACMGGNIGRLQRRNEQICDISNIGVGTEIYLRGGMDNGQECNPEPPETVPSTSIVIITEPPTTESTAPPTTEATTTTEEPTTTTTEPETTTTEPETTTTEPAITTTEPDPTTTSEPDPTTTEPATSVPITVIVPTTNESTTTTEPEPETTTTVAATTSTTSTSTSTTTTTAAPTTSTTSVPPTTATPTTAAPTTAAPTTAAPTTEAPTTTIPAGTHDNLVAHCEALGGDVVAAISGSQALARIGIDPNSQIGINLLYNTSYLSDYWIGEVGSNPAECAPRSIDALRAQYPQAFVIEPETTAAATTTQAPNTTAAPTTAAPTTAAPTTAALTTAAPASTAPATTVAPATTAPATTAPAPRVCTYEVQPGDTYITIAGKFGIDGWGALRKENGLKDLIVGDVIDVCIGD